jgi:putative YphP/YqiW family bacilliredoxin
MTEILKSRGAFMYPEIMVIPMREELTRVGAEELRTAEAVDAALKTGDETILVVVNSICGCAAGRMRPAVRMALENAVRPDRVVTVFAGQDPEATQRAREYFRGYPPSSPSIGLMRNGELLYFMQRGDIETRQAPEIATHLTAAFNRFCTKPVGGEN